MIKHINKITFFLLFAILAFCYFARDNYRGVSDINNNLVNQPIQKETKDNTKIKFTKDDYEYTLTPLYDYEINGMIVHKMDYTWFALYKMDSIFPMDVCMIWGSNLTNKIYQSNDLSFMQDFRFCIYQYFGQINFNGEELSNNHLLINDNKLEEKISNFSAGDQIKIIGQLVNVEATNLGKPGEFDPSKITWNSSTIRTDTGAGACEVIYVKDIQILKKAHPIYYYLFKFCFWGLMLLIFGNIICFFTITSKEFKSTAD